MKDETACTRNGVIRVWEAAGSPELQLKRRSRKIWHLIRQNLGLASAQCSCRLSHIQLPVVAEIQSLVVTALQHNWMLLDARGDITCPLVIHKVIVLILSTKWGPPVINYSYLRITNHTYYWSYVHQLSYCLGDAHCR